MVVHTTGFQSIGVYDSPSCSRNDDWAIAHISAGYNQVQVPTFEHRRPLDPFEPIGPGNGATVFYVEDDGLDGKVSCIRTSDSL